jgi:two-component system phosphate regulon sensor histidine kinase PhoR
MFAEARRMQQLVDDLISLSRIEAEKFRVPQTPIDLGSLIEEVGRSIRAGQRDDERQLVFEAADDVRPIAGDRIQLSQLLHNLIGNALKYGRPGTPVRIDLHNDAGSMARLSVSDEGDGIAPEHLPRLTERFYRVDPGRSRAMGGTGLGLAIVKHIVERHRGRLDIESEVGKGTTVHVLLPLAPEPVSSNCHETVTGN